jgi:uncharacterized FAD-dependent dehydrogenase
MKTLLVNNISLPLDYVGGDAFHEAKKRLRAMHILPSDATFRLYRRSVDARRRDRVHFVASVAVTGSFGELSDRELASGQMSLRNEYLPTVGTPDQRLKARPVIVGCGPAGLFAALALAENGYRPLLIERGGPVDERSAAHLAFQRSRVLDTENNIQFGAGGAGTFSDGKLVTRISDPVTTHILESFVSFGAPDEILWQAKPHIGTDILRGVIDAMCQRLLELGGEIAYHTRLTGIVRRESEVVGIRTTRGEIPCGALILAIGNSANDTYRMLLAEGCAIEAKPFSVGMRIEHLQEDIDAAMYGDFAGHPALGHAEYQLSWDTARRGVYTFCMCPGGEVVAAASNENTVVVNGMSYHARASKNANSAIAVSIFPSDFGGTPDGAMQYRERIERAAYLAGGGRYRAPAYTVGALLEREPSARIGRITPSYLEGDVSFVSPEAYLPKTVLDGIRGALPAFERRIEGFSISDAILTGPETRTSAPNRILRDENRVAIGTVILFPAGEGAGYAGGITSSAADGYRTALALMSLYRPYEND